MKQVREVSIPVNIKRQISADWLHAFPGLSLYKRNELCKIFGPIVAGLQITKLPVSDQYRPHIVVYSLWEKDADSLMETPVVLDQVEDQRGRQFFISYANHGNFFPEAAGSARKKLGISFEKDLGLADLLRIIEVYSNTAVVRSSPVAQATLWACKIHCYIYLNKQAAARKALKKIHKIGKNWPPELFEWKYGPFNEWFRALTIALSERDKFMNHVSRMAQAHKLSKLSRGELVV